MKKMYIQDHKQVEVGALVQHDAEGDDTFWDCEIIDIDNNQLHGLVRYTGGPHEGQEQWVPGNLLREPPVAVEPTPETPVADAMREAGREALKDEATSDEEPKQEESAPTEEQPATNPS